MTDAESLAAAASRLREYERLVDSGIDPIKLEYDGIMDDVWDCARAYLAAAAAVRDAERAALGRAAGVAKAKASEHRRCNKDIRSRPDYDEDGPAGDVAAMEASLAQECSELAAAIRALAPESAP